MTAIPPETNTLPAQRPPLLSALLVALGVGVLSVLLPALRLPPAVLLLPVFIAVVIIGVMPFFVAGGTARLVVRQASPTAHQEMSFVDHLLTALYWLRIYLAVLAGLLAGIAIQGASVARETMISLNAGCLDGCMWPLLMPEPNFERLDRLLLVFFAGWGIGHLGISWLAAALGTSMALWRRRVGQAVVLSAALILVPVFALYLPLPGILFNILEVSSDAANSGNLPIFWAAMYALAPFVLGLLITGLAQLRHSRSATAA